jgi:hypothetical protein
LNLALEFLARAMRQKHKTKEIQSGKEDVALSLFADDISLYLNGPEEPTKNLLDLINILTN